MIVSTRCCETRVDVDNQEDEITLTLPSSLVFITADNSEETPEYDIGLNDKGRLMINGFSFEEMLKAYTKTLPN